MTPQEFRNYLAAGVVCQSLWPGVEERSPVAYLYNGVRELELPDEIKSYPYILMCVVSGDNPTSDTTTKFVYGFVEKPYTIVHDTILNDWDSTYAEEGALRHANHYPTLDPGAWSYIGEEEISDVDIALSHITWANYDIYTSTGELFMPASEPVPVYE